MASAIQDYVVANWDTLPKSSFNDDEMVTIQCFHDDNEGWGHHSYSGVGVAKDGRVLWSYSSGCSCHGSCGLEHKLKFKTLEADFDLSAINPEDVNFKELEAHFSDY